MATVSACMIVKNEESMLPRCLESIKWVDELIIVDTGSTDRTVEIAESYGANVYHHPWQNDFSLHRNQSISYASGDWILIIDADEDLSTIPDQSSFSERLDILPAGVGALALTVRESGNGTEWIGTRLFRREGFRGYKGIVHNKSDYDGECAGTDLVLIHYGYSLATEKLVAKQQRSEALLRERLEKDPNDYIAMFYLQQICVVQNRSEEAVDFGRKCLELYAKDYKGDMQYLHGIYYMQGVAYMKLRDGTNAMAWAEKGLERRPDDIDLHYLMARIGWESMDDEMLKKHGQRYLELYDQHGMDIDSSKGTFENPFDGGRFARNVTVFTRRPDTLEQIRGWMGEA